MSKSEPTNANTFRSLKLHTTALAAALVVSLPAGAALAQGGAGQGTGGGIGAAGGASNATGAGGSGANGGTGGTVGFGGGGGGAGATGGAGGSGGEPFEGPGGLGGSAGAGGASPGANGQNGGNGSQVGLERGGGGGGGGGAHGGVRADLGVVTATTGGNGGAGGASAARAGGGGAGGFGLVATGTGNLGTLASNVTGGGGGSGGTGATGPSSGGLGGKGFVFSGIGAKSATITAAVSGGSGGSSAAGGVGIEGGDLSLTLQGSVSGGQAGGGGARANALNFTGGDNALTLGSGWSLTGGIGVTGSLNFNQPTDATVSNIISGTGSISKTNVGALTLSGANTYSGLTTIAGGTLSIDTDGNLGDGSSTNGLVINGGVLQTTFTIFMDRGVTIGAAGGTIDIGGSLLSLDGSVAFNGLLTKTGTGLLLLQAANTGAGGIRLDQGQLAVNTNSSLGTGTLTMAEGTSIRFDQAGLTFANAFVLGGGAGSDISPTDFVNHTILSGVLSGGRLNVVGGAGNLTLAGANTYGATTVSAGNGLLIGNGGTTGTLGTGGVTLTSDESELGFYRSNTYTVANVISGLGSVEQLGTGTTILTGANTYTGPTTVSAGTLRVNGSLSGTSGVAVSNSATLGGTGTINAPVTISSGGILAPGASVGTLTTGNLTLNSGSITEIEVLGPAIDLINVNGTASLAGTLKLLPTGGNYTFNTPYTFISSTGALSGTFGTVNTTGTFGVGVTPAVSYTANAAQLTLTPGSLVSPSSPPLLGGLTTTNTNSVAGSLDRAVQSGQNVSAYFNAYNQPTPQSVLAAINSLSGEVHTATSAIGVQSTSDFFNTLLDPMVAGRTDTMLAFKNSGRGAERVQYAAAEPTTRTDIEYAPDKAGSRLPYAIWGAAFGHSGDRDGDGTVVGSANSSSSSANLAVGLDVSLSDNLIAGVGVAAGKSQSKLSNGLGSADADVLQIGAFAATRFGPATVRASGVFASLDTTTTRAIPVLGLASVKGKYTSDVWSGRIEGTYQVYESEGLSASPFLALEAREVKTPAFTEHNALTGVAAGILAQKKSNTTSRVELGVEISNAPAVKNGDVNLMARAAWGHYLERNAGLTASLVGLNNSSFFIQGAKPEENSALLTLGLETKLSDNLSLSARADGDVSSSGQSVAGSVQARFTF